MTSHGVPKGSGGSKPVSEPAREKELQKIQNYQTLVEDVNTQIKERRFTLEVLDLISKLLKINPEYYTIWNHRRLIIQHLFHASSQEDPLPSPHLREINQLISNDLNFLVPLLRKYPKCYWIWKYRLWLLEQATRLLPAAESQQFWQVELSLVGKMLSLDSRNFHGWGYRRKVIAALEQSNPNNNDPPKTNSMTESEFNYTTRMIETNLSNFSAWHNRSKLLPKLLKEQSATQQQQQNALDQELFLIQRALYADSTDQSLWSYHQFLLTTFHPPHPATNPATNPDPIVPNLSPPQRLAYVRAEFEKITEMREGSEDCKWMYIALIELARLHKGLSGGWPVDGDRVGEWVGELRRLDPMRKGRWDDLEEELGGL